MSNFNLKAADLHVGQEVTIIRHGNGYGLRVNLAEGFKVSRITKTRISISKPAHTSIGGEIVITYVINKYGEVAQEVGKESYRTDSFLPADHERIASWKANNALVDIKETAMAAARKAGEGRSLSTEDAEAAVAALQAFLNAQQ